ncbi:hypothetical protein LTR53_011502 [Teratosphaeriaceae sp. CCFEE 6253]|nr:hypothetical protein LTR53_011502 [Teratosphaeriaceae sp. CCFEE 6253]
MPAHWTGSLLVSDHEVLDGIALHATSPSIECVPEKAALRFLSLVNVSCIPLHLRIGPAYRVTTTVTETESFFSRYLLASHDDAAASRWWQTAQPDSSLGILAAVEPHQSIHPGIGPRPTEILFYASRHLDVSGPSAAAGEQSICVNAITLSSDLLVPATESTPPGTPVEFDGDYDGEIAGVLLPLSVPPKAEIINEPPVRKRKSVTDSFDEAAERRRKARRSGGGGVAAAAAVRNESSMPSLKHRRTASISESQAAPTLAGRTSRSPSLASSRPATAGAPVEAMKRSSLSRVQSISAPPVEETLEDKNKSAISRVVMAGMRLHGFTQSKSRKTRASSATPALAANDRAEPDALGRQSDEEYKLLYHQVFKGMCFAYREHMSKTSLQPHAEALRETVDRLLDVYCNDPLKAGLPSMADERTPGGRKAFGTGMSTSGCDVFGTQPILHVPPG